MSVGPTTGLMTKPALRICHVDQAALKA